MERKIVVISAEEAQEKLRIPNLKFPDRMFLGQKNAEKLCTLLGNQDAIEIDELQMTGEIDAEHYNQISSAFPFFRIITKGLEEMYDSFHERRVKEEVKRLIKQHSRGQSIRFTAYGIAKILVKFNEVLDKFSTYSYKSETMRLAFIILLQKLAIVSIGKQIIKELQAQANWEERALAIAYTLDQFDGFWRDLALMLKEHVTFEKLLESKSFQDYSNSCPKGMQAITQDQLREIFKDIEELLETRKIEDIHIQEGDIHLRIFIDSFPKTGERERAASLCYGEITIDNKKFELRFGRNDQKLFAYMNLNFDFEELISEEQCFNIKKRILNALFDYAISRPEDRYKRVFKLRPTPQLKEVREEITELIEEDKKEADQKHELATEEKDTPPEVIEETVPKTRTEEETVTQIKTEEETERSKLPTIIQEVKKARNPLASRLSNIPGKKALAAFKRLCKYIRTKGSHHIFKATNNKKICIPVHGNDPVGFGLLLKELDRADISAEDFLNNL